MSEQNQENIYQPEFIPYRPSIKEKYNLTTNETLCYGFIKFYAKNNKFYFSSKQFGKILDVKATTIDNYICTLKKKELIKTDTKRYNVDDKIKSKRFIYLPNSSSSHSENSPSSSENENTTSSHNEDTISSQDEVKDKYKRDINKRNNTKSNDLEEQSSIAEKKESDSEINPVKEKDKKKKNSPAKKEKEYGNEDINNLLNRIKEVIESVGKLYSPGKNERKRAYNRLTAKKINGVDFKQKVLDKFNRKDNIENRIQVAERLIEKSHKNKYIKKANNMEELYYNWTRIFNQIMEQLKEEQKKEKNDKVADLSEYDI